ncbi:MgtC/SapB family protein [Novipirellula artificiosorum]|uniref:MgtC family protein n=1 Tax=Novipirellula artificiosorum TaxID=2528016 RepID=A0A5C6D9I7_9BACT|nr:MgtC/SapB family protein [Novipirellula artificiosorum]TWU33418.1 MgtC family protein [Novipirellula artificiosorum]
MPNSESYLAIALSVGLGLLVGLQRQWKASEVAGIRTFPLITMLGAIMALVSGGQSQWPIGAGLLGVASLLVMANLIKVNAGKVDPGITTESAALLMFGVGVALGYGMNGPAIVVTGVVSVLLQWKRLLHDWVSRIGENDLRGITNLVLISLVILPLLPDQTYGPYQVLNPYKIWLMVVLIVGISMVAYVLYKVLGAGVGAILGGILGGLISSTATTVSYARQTKSNPSISSIAALVIVIASTIVNVRVIGEIALVAPKLLQAALPPIAIVLAVMVLECIVLLLLLRRTDTQLPDHENPSQLKPAIVFGALYAVVLFIVAAAKHHFGNEALYVIAMISGLTDVDAITLSTAKMFQDGNLDETIAWRVILIATMSNLVFKAVAVAILGSRRLFVYVLILFAIAFLAATALLAYWPDTLLPSSYASVFSNP